MTPNPADNFPDFSLPERADPSPSPPPQPLPLPPLSPLPDAIQPAPSPTTRWTIGDRVLAPWEPNFLYVGDIQEIADGQALIEFDDGNVGWVLVDQLQPLSFQRGQKVFDRRASGRQSAPAEIVDVRGNDVTLRFADTGREETTTLQNLRIPCEPTGPGAVPMQAASNLEFFANLMPGTRVWAPWVSGVVFAGTIHELKGDEVHIHFDDGDRGWVRADQLMPLEITIGLRVMCRWRMGTQFFAGTVVDFRDGRALVRYDDGKQEWVKPAALALQSQPFGPDARATRIAAGGGNSVLITVLIIVVLIVGFALRCR